MNHPWIGGELLAVTGALLGVLSASGALRWRVVSARSRRCSERPAGEGDLEWPVCHGVLHVGAAAASLPAAYYLIASGQDVTAQSAAWIYGVSLVMLFTFSGVYHLIEPRRRGLLKRLDHACICSFIAATFTPFALLMTPRSGSWWLLAVWLLASVGVVVKLRWPELCGWRNQLLYSGCLVAPAYGVVSLHAVIGSGTLSLFLAGAMVYAAGTLVLGRQWPRLAECTFGYHELWHALVIVAAALQWMAIARVVPRL